MVSNNVFLGNIIFSNKFHMENWLFKKEEDKITFAPQFKRWLFQEGDRFNDYVGYSKLWNSIKENREFIERYVLLNYTKRNVECESSIDLNMKINTENIDNSYNNILFKYEKFEEDWFYHIYYSNMWLVDILEPFTDLKNILCSSPMDLIVNNNYWEISENIFESFGFDSSSDFSKGHNQLKKYWNMKLSFKFDNGMVMILNSM
ncbi:hypothetical protein [Methanobrevibacter sp.]